MAVEGRSNVALWLLAEQKTWSMARENASDLALGEHLSGINCGRTKLLLDPQELVVLGQAVRARQRAGLDLAALGGDREIGDRCILGLAGAPS